MIPQVEAQVANWRGPKKAKMEQVRPFVAEDIPQVAELHCRVFNTGDPSSLKLHRSYRSYFSELFLRHPWHDQTVPSLVCQDSRGKILGFLGVMPRPMSVAGQPLQAAISSQFIVDPDKRSTLAGVQLLRAFVSGPQDLSIADEANDSSRKLWENLGGTTALLYSLYWGRVLRPVEFVMSRLRRRRLWAPFAWASTPVCRVADRSAAYLSPGLFRQPAPSVAGEDLTAETLLACLSKCSGIRSLRPEYDHFSLNWLLDVLARKRSHGAFQKIALRNGAGEAVGWYLYYCKPGEVGEVLQIGAEDHWIDDVLDHLFHHAWQRGVVALTGRLEPRFLQRFRDKNCLFHHRGYWVLVRAKSPELLHAIHRGDAFLTRLEGEWCMRFDADG